MGEFRIRVNDGQEQSITVETGIYVYAAMAVPALLGQQLPLVVEIWAAHLVPEYGTYLYRIREDALGRPLIEQVVRDAIVGSD